VHEDILLVLKILVEASFGNAAVFDVEAFSKPYSANSSIAAFMIVSRFSGGKLKKVGFGIKCDLVVI
jgi:hypothetical protein